MTEFPKKLIEVALPLDDINREAAREKSIRHGHPSTLHLWWARRPLAAARAVLFAQLVNDPGGKRGYGAYKGQTKEEALKERERLFDIIRELVKWENTNNEELLERARAEIRKSWEETCKITGDDPSKLPAFHDPFAGGGTIPLEAQRLGLEAYASDLNPVAVLINKAMIEIPPKFAGKPPVNPEARQSMGHSGSWRGAQGLAEDVRYYGKWMRDEAEKRIGHLYPQIEITNEMAKDRPDLKLYVGRKLTIIAWIWVRTVKSPNPAYSNVDVPLASTFMLSTQAGKEAYVEPVIENGGYRFTVKVGRPKDAEGMKNGTKISRGANFRCLMSEAPMASDYVKAEGRAGRMGARMMAIVAEGERGRVYLAPTPEMEAVAFTSEPMWKPQTPLPDDPRNFWTVQYGLTHYCDLFTPRQLVALTTFADLVQEAREQVKRDALVFGLANDGQSLNAGGTGATAYADAVGVYLGVALSRISSYWSSITTHDTSREKITSVFARQAIPMAWDFMEGNPFSDTSGNFLNSIEASGKSLSQLLSHVSGFVSQADAQSQDISMDKLVSTDPPYYDNIGYADLSDFFYVWLRHSLKSVFPELFATLAVPKAEELVATPYRHGNKEKAETFFLDGMTRAIQNLSNQAHSAFPVTIYYAFKQSESSDTGTTSTGWETFLEAVLRAGLAVNGTWPMRTEMPGRALERSGTNALASSIILVCRKRALEAAAISRKDFLRELKNALPDALQDMIGGTEAASPIAPVDLAQAAIGPGMAVFSKYKSVLEADGTPMSVHSALILINKAIDEYFTEVEGEMDADTRFCVGWFQQYGFKDGVFGEADVLARAKGTSVDGIEESGVLSAKAGKVRLLKVAEYPDNWNPQSDKRVPIWEACHQMCRALQISETRAGELLAKMPEKAEAVRQLAYRLYTLCERKKWADHAALYNGLITSWHAILEESHKVGHAQAQQELFSG
jgi:putative DNA methylase